MMDPTSVEIETAVHDWRQGEYRKPGFVNVQAEQVKVLCIMFELVAKEY